MRDWISYSISKMWHWPAYDISDGPNVYCCCFWPQYAISTLDCSVCWWIIFKSFSGCTDCPGLVIVAPLCKATARGALHGVFSATCTILYIVLVTFTKKVTSYCIGVWCYVCIVMALNSLIQLLILHMPARCAQDNNKSHMFENCVAIWQSFLPGPVSQCTSMVRHR